MGDEASQASSQLHFELLALGESMGRCETKGPASFGYDNFYKSVDWSPDGTCVVTNSADNHIRTVIIPPNLLEDHDQALKLEPYCTIPSLEPVNVLTCYPHFDLQDPSTALILSSASEHPIRLNSSLTSQLVASYPLVSSTTEAYIKPHSLVFTAEGGKFIAGAESLLSVFDVSRTGYQPVSSVKTGPRNRRASWSNPGMSLRGFISALDIDRQYNVLAAGTLSRQVGLYDAAGQGECVGVFSVKDTEADLEIFGGGITQLSWSKCGRYLYITERKSDGFIVYDIRKTGQLLSWAKGRSAMTNQRMKVELAINPDTVNEGVWAGGTDGFVRHWEAPHLSEGPVEPDSQLKIHEGHVNSMSKHHMADVLVTAAGQRQFLDRSAVIDHCFHLWHIRP